MWIRIDPALAPALTVGGLLLEEVAVTAGEHRPLEDALAAAEAESRDVYAGRSPAEIGGLARARRLYRSLGIDPTRMRPASEALLRRVLKGEALPRINSAVNAANLASLTVLLPVGLYDAAKIEGDVELRLGREGESYARIGSGSLSLAGRIGLFDRRGGFGNPTGDSRRTAVAPGTDRLLFVMFAPASVSAMEMAEHIEDASRTLRLYLAGSEAGRVVMGGEGMSTVRLGT